MNISEFAQKQQELLQQEQAAEHEQILEQLQTRNLADLQRSGIVLQPVTITSIRSALGGNSYYTIQTAVGGLSELPYHTLRVGQVVKIESLSKDEYLLEGVLVKITDTQLNVSVIGEIPDAVIPDRLKLLKLANNVSYKRMYNAMTDLAKESQAPRDITKVLFNLATPSFSSVPEVEYFDKLLNDSQKIAVKHCLSADQLSLIHGPPGTGKTQTLIEVIKQLVKLGKKVLVTGPSNISVDNLVERIAGAKFDIVRLGHPARILDSVLLYSLEYQLQYSDGGHIVNDVRKELDSNLHALGKCRRKGDRKVIYKELKTLRSEVRGD